jgi:hypothetical protein
VPGRKARGGGCGHALVIAQAIVHRERLSPPVRHVSPTAVLFVGGASSSLRLSVPG